MRSSWKNGGEKRKEKFFVSWESNPEHLHCQSNNSQGFMSQLSPQTLAAAAFFCFVV
jgi:hypothetical protein